MNRRRTSNPNPPAPPCCRTLLPALHANDIYYFPEGLPGFEHVKGFTVKCRRSMQPFFFLQSLSTDRLFFACIDPFLVLPDYDPIISRSDAAQLELAHPQQALFIALATLPPSSEGVTINLRAPIALNKPRRLAKQVDCGPHRYPLHYRLTHSFRLTKAFETDEGAGGPSCGSCTAYTLCHEAEETSSLTVA